MSSAGKRIIVRGRVQGVGFRYFCQRLANSGGICGWVKNRSDRTVEILAVGEADALEIFLASVRQGPPSAHVEDIGETSLDPTQSAEAVLTETFEIF